MNHNGQSSMGTEHNERSVQHAEMPMSATENHEGQMLLDTLIEQGFVWEEAVKLLHLREHLYENTEMTQRMADDCRMQFARWLYEQGEIGEV